MANESTIAKHACEFDHGFGQLGALSDDFVQLGDNCDSRLRLCCLICERTDLAAGAIDCLEQLCFSCQLEFLERPIGVPKLLVSCLAYSLCPGLECSGDLLNC